MLLLAAGEGFEPSHTESESAVLPLHNPAKRKEYYTDFFQFVKYSEEICYPGSLELRESVVENVLLPIASDLGLPFTVDELRAYETRKKLQNMKPDVAVEEGEPVEDPPTYWLLESGWEWDDEPIRKKEALLRDIAGI